MRGLVIASLVSALLVSGCTNGPPTRAAEVKAISIGDKAYRCLKRNDIGASSGSIELTGDLRARMLTPQATIAGVRVFIESTSVTTYGSQTVYFVNSTNDCLLWAEGITMQESRGTQPRISVRATQAHGAARDSAHYAAHDSAGGSCDATGYRGSQQVRHQ
jgi:hypothetical protein